MYTPEGWNCIKDEINVEKQVMQVLFLKAASSPCCLVPHNMTGYWDILSRFVCLRILFVRYQDFITATGT